AAARVIHVTPDGPWCTLANKAQPGDQVVLAAGTYTTSCELTITGKAGAPIIVGSASSDPGERAVFAYPGSPANVRGLTDATFVTIRWLTFTATQPNVTAIVVHHGSDVSIQGNVFQQIGGVAVAANRQDTERITIAGNSFIGLQATAIYLGCHDGNHCRSRDG